MRKTLIVIVTIVILTSGALWSVGLSPTDLKANLDVGTGMGAKLACSGRYVSGFEPEKISEDLASYSAATEALDIEYDDEQKTVSVSLLGLGTTSATFRPGLGCTLNIGKTEALDNLYVPSWPEPPRTTKEPNWPVGSLVSTLNPGVQGGLEEILAGDNRKGLDTRALIAVQSGKIVGEVYSEGITPHTPLLGWSMGKSLTSLMLGHLAYIGHLNTHETSLFPAWKTDERDNISVLHLLQMSSGLDFSEIYAPGSDATYMLFNAHSAADVALQSTLAHLPGSHFSYSSGTTNLLSALFVTRMGGSQAALDTLYNDILIPLGMRHTVLEMDPSGVFVGSSYHYSSPRDWARLGLVTLNNGELNGATITDPAWFHQAQQPNRSYNEPRYGYQFWLNRGTDDLRWPELPIDAYAMTGHRGQVVMMIPSIDVVLVRLGWTATRYPTNQTFKRIIDVLDPNETQD